MRGDLKVSRKWLQRARAAVAGAMLFPLVAVPARAEQPHGGRQVKLEVEESDLWAEGKTAGPSWNELIDGCMAEDRCYCPYTPNMIGDFFSGYSAGAQGTFAVDRLLVIAENLDAPPAPPGNQPLVLSEPGPVGIHSSALTSIQELQQILRSAGIVPTTTLVNTFGANASLTTVLNVSQIQAQLAATPGVPFDIVMITAPPAAYTTAVDAEFQARNTMGGTTTFQAGSSGALLQSGDALNGGEELAAFYFYTYAVAVNVASPSAGLSTGGRLKVADGNSPLPQDRVFFRYGFFDSVPIANGGVNMNRFIPGFEKTFLDGIMSIEARFPFASSIDNQITTGPGAVTNTGDASFGNIATYFKVVLAANQLLAVSGGLGVTAPTADDVSVRFVNGPELVRIQNEAVHLQPFVAALYTPDDRWFAHGFFQLDIDANGNPVHMSSGNGLGADGRLNDSTFLFTDVGLGYWWQRPTQHTPVGVAPTVELHYNRSLQDADHLTSGNMTVGNFGEDIEAINLTLGSTVTYGNSARLALGYIAPIGADRQLDGGLRVMLDYLR